MTALLLFGYSWILTSIKSMATAASSTVYNLVKVGNLELEYEGHQDPDFIGLTVLSQNLVMVIDQREDKVRLHSLHDGHLIDTYCMQSSKLDTCICHRSETDIQVAVSLLNAVVLIFCINSSDRILRLIRTLDLRGTFDACYGMKSLDGNLVVSGQKKKKLCWGTVSIPGGQVVTFNKICSYREDGEWLTALTVHPERNAIFIACDTGGAYCGTDNYEGEEYPATTGVYGYKRSEQIWFYSDEDLKEPRSITIDKWGYIFVANKEPPCIHQLTETGQIVTIYKEGMPSSPEALFWEKNGELFLTSSGTRVITKYKPVYSHQHVTSLQFACRDIILNIIQPRDIVSLPLPAKLKQFLQNE